VDKGSLVDSSGVRLPGHVLLTPDGRQIRVPKHAYSKLRRFRLLKRDFDGPRIMDPDDGRPIPEISAGVYKLMGSELDVMLGLRKLLGLDCEGPAVVHCDCRLCRLT